MTPIFKIALFILVLLASNFICFQSGITVGKNEETTKTAEAHARTAEVALTCAEIVVGVPTKKPTIQNPDEMQ